jgi:hypothetical protein
MRIFVRSRGVKPAHSSFARPNTHLVYTTDDLRAGAVDSIRIFGPARRPARVLSAGSSRPAGCCCRTVWRREVAKDRAADCQAGGRRGAREWTVCVSSGITPTASVNGMRTRLRQRCFIRKSKYDGPLVSICLSIVWIPLLLQILLDVSPAVYPRFMVERQ